MYTHPSTFIHACTCILTHIHTFDFDYEEQGEEQVLLA